MSIASQGVQTITRNMGEIAQAAQSANAATQSVRERTRAAG